MLFRIHRMKDQAREHFRASAHTSGTAIVKAKDYERAGEIISSSPYAAWATLRTAGQPLETGDILEDECGSLRIAKYVGFEAAQWWVAEQRTAPSPAGAEPAAVSGTGTDLPSIHG